MVLDHGWARRQRAAVEAELVDGKDWLADEPTWTGRCHGSDEVIERGRDYVVVEYDAEQGERADVSPDFASGVYVVAREGSQDLLSALNDAWSSVIGIRAYNAEDAYRNRDAAMCQWRAWFDATPGHCIWVPFQDRSTGECPETGGVGPYAAPPSDEEARDGVTRCDLFGEDVLGPGRWAFVPDGTAPGPAPSPAF